MSSNPTMMGVGLFPTVVRYPPNPNPLCLADMRKSVVARNSSNSNSNKVGLSSEADVVVIGSGIGGLCCASLLARYEEDVLVLESHDLPGGAAHSFHIKNYKFDSGPSLFSGLQSRGPQANPLAQVLDALGESLPCATYDSWMVYIPEGDFLSRIGPTEFCKDLDKYAGPNAVQEWKKLLGEDCGKGSVEVCGRSDSIVGEFLKKEGLDHVSGESLKSYNNDFVNETPVCTGNVNPSTFCAVDDVVGVSGVKICKVREFPSFELLSQESLLDGVNLESGKEQAVIVSEKAAVEVESSYKN
ncbi:hypothetical protein OROGR_014523 [Orobanche gracilis]